jgi:hypothetical protein
LLAHGRWFSPGTPASSTTKTGRHDIAEILLKVALKHQKSNQIKRPDGGRPSNGTHRMTSDKNANARNQNRIYLKFHLHRPVWLMGIGSRKDWHRL